MERLDARAHSTDGAQVRSRAERVLPERRGDARSSRHPSDNARMNARNLSRRQVTELRRYSAWFVSS